MRVRSAALLIVAALCAWGVLRAQRPFKEYQATEYNDFPLPQDFSKKTEWTRARLKYPSIYGGGGGFGGFGRRRGGYGGDLNWTIDYPRSDRHLLEGVRRLTRIDTRSVEQVVELDGTDDVYNWPMMYAVEVGHWKLRDQDAAQLREFLLRGGFLMVDDFHGNLEWSNFTQGMNRVFPDRPIVELPPTDPIFHVLYDLGIANVEAAAPGGLRILNTIHNLGLDLLLALLRSDPLLLGHQGVRA